MREIEGCPSGLEEEENIFELIWEGWEGGEAREISSISPSAPANRIHEGKSRGINGEWRDNLSLA